MAIVQGKIERKSDEMRKNVHTPTHTHTHTHNIYYPAYEEQRQPLISSVTTYPPCLTAKKLINIFPRANGSLQIVEVFFFFFFSSVFVAS